MVEVQNVEARSRYELVLDGQLVGIAEYRVAGDTVVFPHTEILPSFRDRGLGAVLVQQALDDVRATGRRIVPTCWFVGRFVQEHPEYSDLVAP